MLLRNVRIENFRCFKKIDVGLDKTTVLIGENNSGKTSFLDAVRFCLSRTIMRRDAGLEDYDYHLASEAAQPDQTDQLKIVLDFETGEDPPSELVQALGDIHVIDGHDLGHVIIQMTSKFDPVLKDFASDWNPWTATAIHWPVKRNGRKFSTRFFSYALCSIFQLCAMPLENSRGGPSFGGLSCGVQESPTILEINCRMRSALLITNC